MITENIPMVLAVVLPGILLFAMLAIGVHAMGREKAAHRASLDARYRPEVSEAE